MTILFPQDHFLIGRWAKSVEHAQISQSQSPASLFSAYHSLSWLTGDWKTWYCLLPQFPPLPPAYLRRQRRMRSSSLYIPTPALRGRALRRANWCLEGRAGATGRVGTCCPGQPPQPTPDDPSCEQDPLRKHQFWLSWGATCIGWVFLEFWEWVGLESLETLPRDLTLTRCACLVIAVGKGSQC